MVRVGKSRFPHKTSGKHFIIGVDYNKTINGHTLIAGTSGSGKTHTIKSFCQQLSLKNCTTVVFDVHNDIDINTTVTVELHETSEYGINPFIVSTNEKNGGVRRNIRKFIKLIENNSRALGDKQKAVMINLLGDLYAANGFYADSPDTWSLRGEVRGKPKKHPTIKDLLRFTANKYRKLAIGGGDKSYKALEQLNKKMQQLYRKGAKAEHEEELSALKTSALEHFSSYVENITSGYELDEFLKYDSKEVLKSTLDRITTLDDYGIFDGRDPVDLISLDGRGRGYRIKIKNLEDDAQKMFVELSLRQLFEKAKARGEVDTPDLFIFLDEADMFMCKEKEHIINIILKQGRKFGIALCLSSQSLSHFPDDVVGNTAVKIILAVAESNQESTARKLRIETKRIQHLKPQQTALVFLKHKGENTIAVEATTQDRPTSG